MADKDSMAYIGTGINRAALWRGDAERIQSFMKDKNARVVPIWKQRHLIVQASDAGPRPRYLSFAEIENRFDLAAAPPVFLGVHDNTPWFALGLPESEASPEFSEGAFQNIMEIIGLLPTHDASLLAYARGMVIWHDTHKFCGRCGAPMAATEGGHSRTCTNESCKHRSYPRTDPVAITLVIHPDGERCLLGRQPSWPAGFYSCVAGFVEPGETIEAAAARETFEETGIEVADVTYMASQPWPFPASLMLGFRARAVNVDFNREDEELEDCRWFTPADLAAFGDGFADTTKEFRLPPVSAIARFLIDGWLQEKKP